MRDEEFIQKLIKSDGSFDKMKLKFSFMLTQPKDYLVSRLNLFKEYGITKVNIRKSRFGSGYTIEPRTVMSSGVESSPNYEDVMKEIMKLDNFNLN